MNKKGVSSVITTALLILMAIAAVLLVWTFLRPVLSKLGSSIVQDDLTTIMDIKKGSVGYTPSGSLSFVVSREIGKGNVVGVLVVFNDINGKSATLRYNNSIKELEGVRYEVNQSSIGLDNISSISIVPIYNQGGKESFGSIKDSYTLVNVGTISSTATCSENWNYSIWSACSSGHQSRTANDLNFCNTTNSRGALTQNCGCTENWNYSIWSACSSGQQSRTANDLNSCGTTINRGNLTQSCSCTETWTYSAWSTCSSGQQSRTATDANNCGTINTRGALTQTCVLSVTAPKDYLIYWNFSQTTLSNQNVVDIAGYLNGSLSTGSTSIFYIAPETNCISDRCIDFIDPNGGGYVYSSPNLQHFDFSVNSGFTFSLWFNYSPSPAGSNSWKKLVGINNYFWPIFIDLNDSGNLAAYLYNSQRDMDGIKTMVSLNTWHFLTFTLSKDGYEGKLYIDNNSVIIKDSMPSLSSGNPYFYLGYSSYGPSYQGLIDEVKYYNRTLNDSEVGALYHLYK